MTGLYLEEVELFWGHHSEAETQPLQSLLISAGLDCAGQQLHCVVRSLLVVNLLLHPQTHHVSYDPPYKSGHLCPSRVVDPPLELMHYPVQHADVFQLS